MSSASLASEYVADTMALVLHLENRRSSTTVTTIFNEADQNRITIHIPAIVLAEIFYLFERGRISIGIAAVEAHIVSHHNYRQIPLDLAVIKNAQNITDIPELHDRLIASTANFCGLELITNDAKIQNSAFVQTIW